MFGWQEGCRKRVGGSRETKSTTTVYSGRRGEGSRQLAKPEHSLHLAVLGLITWFHTTNASSPKDVLHGVHILRNSKTRTISNPHSTVFRYAV